MAVRSLLLCFTLLLGAADAARAATRPWIELHGGLATYSMKDVNDELDAVNATVGPGGPQFDPIHSGAGFGGSIGIELETGFSLGLGIDRLTARAEMGDASATLTYDLPANVVRVFAEYSVLGPGQSGMYLGGGLHNVVEEGSIELAVPGEGTLSGHLSGSGLGFEGFVGGRYWANPAIALEGSAGYRLARAMNIEVRGMPVYNASGDRYSVDYSGLFLRAGVRVALAR